MEKDARGRRSGESAARAGEGSHQPRTVLESDARSGVPVTMASKGDLMKSPMDQSSWAE